MSGDRDPWGGVGVILPCKKTGGAPRGKNCRVDWYLLQPFRALKYTLALVVVFVSQIVRAELNVYREY